MMLRSLFPAGLTSGSGERLSLRRRRRRWAQGASLASLLLSTAACDPCFGTTACVEPHIYASGHLIWHLDGAPARGVEVTFRPDPGSPLLSDSVRAVSNREGIFRLSISTGRTAEVTGTLSFRPPEPYSFHGLDVGGVRLITTEVRGSPQFLGSWSVGPVPGPPHISYVGELIYDDTAAPAVGVEVEFQRTGGIAVVPDSFVVVTDQFARFALFMTPAGEGQVIGDLFVRPPPPYRPLTITGVRMATLAGIGDIRLLGTWRITR